MTPPNLWELTLVPLEAPKQRVSLTTFINKDYPGKSCLNSLGGKKVRNIAYEHFTMYLHQNHQSKSPRYFSERRAATSRTLIANAVVFLHVPGHLFPGTSTKEVMRPTPT